jgi:hypothetical protein
MGYSARQILVPSARGISAYYRRTLVTDPIAYWPLWEKSGTVAECLVNPVQNGTYDSDVSGWPPGAGIGDGNTAPYFSGNDSVNVFSTSLRDAFDEDEGTVSAWCRVLNVGVWSDAAIRHIIYAFAAGTSLVRVRKEAAVNEVRGWHTTSGFTTQEFTTTTTAWFHVVFRWSKAAERVDVYMDGTEYTNLGPLSAWAGALTSVYIGSDGVANEWQGWLAHVAFWDRVLTAPEIGILAGV